MCFAGQAILAGTSAEQPSGISLLESLEKTLSKDPNIRIQRQDSRIAEGALQVQSGAFDAVLSTSADFQRDHSSLNSMVSDGGVSQGTLVSANQSVALQKPLRSGLIMGPEVQISQMDARGDGVDPVNLGRINFVIQIPLMKGRGKDAAGAQEKSAQQLYEASLWSLRHTAAESVLNTVLSYWNYQTSKQSLDILQESEIRAKTLVDQIRVLVDADERPKADLDQLLANLADKITSRSNAEQIYFEAKHQLGLAMGLPYKEIELLPDPMDSFPPKGTLHLNENQSSYWIDQAMRKRADLAVSRLNEKALSIIMVSAKNGLLPQTDFRLSTGYAGSEDGRGTDAFYGALGDPVSGLNVLASVHYEWPFSNRAARGRHLQAQANYEKSVIRTDNLARNISSRVVVALSALQQSVLEHAQSERAIELYQTAVENEKKKFRLGMSTLLDVIDIEDRLLSARLNQVLIEQRYANALAEFRFQTGTLIIFQGEQHSVDITRILNISNEGDLNEKP